MGSANVNRYDDAPAFDAGGPVGGPQTSNASVTDEPTT
jgi:hypothetical protein